MDASHIPLNDTLREQLSYVIEQTKRQPQGQLFSTPVEWQLLGIPDYPKVIKNPMDLTTLKANLQQYQYLKDFIIDSELIWSNCRIYNGQSQEGFYFKAANDCERFFVQQIIKIKDLGFTLQLYKKVVGQDEEKVQQEEFGSSQIQQLVKKLQELPEVYMLECLQWYCDAKGMQIDFEVPQFQLSFKTEDANILKQLEAMIQKKIQEIKESKKKVKKEKE